MKVLAANAAEYDHEQDRWEQGSAKQWQWLHDTIREIFRQERLSGRIRCIGNNGQATTDDGTTYDRRLQAEVAHKFRDQRG